jgi:hypothetical protein
MNPALLLSALAPAPPPAQSAPPPEPQIVEPIVVTGTRGRRPRVAPDAVDVVRTFCFETARVTGKLQTPSSDVRWVELDEKARRQFHISDASVAAYALDDAARGQQLWLKTETFAQPGELEEQRCTVLVIGGRDHRRFIEAMSKLFGGVPTQRHVGVRDGSPAVAGWEQWLWTGMPPHGSKAWKAIEQPRGGAPSWVVVSDVARFYDSYDYIMGDMKLRQGPGPPITMLSFSLTRRLTAGPAKGRAGAGRGGGSSVRSGPS